MIPWQLTEISAKICKTKTKLVNKLKLNRNVQKLKWQKHITKTQTKIKLKTASIKIKAN